MASNIKGITIEIGGNTSGLKQALKDVDKSLASTQKELKEVDKGLKLDPKNVTLLTQKQGLLSDAIKDTTSRLETLKRAKEQAEESGSVDKNSKEYRELEREIESATQKLNGFKNQQDQVNDSLKNVNNTGGSFYEKVTALSTGFLAVKEASQMALETIKKVADAVLDVGRKADEINTLATQFNLTTEQVQLFQKSANLIDVDFNTIAGAYSKLMMNIDSDSLAKELEEIGVAVKDASGEYRDINDIFNDTIKGLSKIDNETKKDAKTMNIFGKSASSLATIIDDGGENLSKFSKYLKENNLIMDQDSLDTLNRMNDAYDTLSVTTESIGDRFLSTFAKPMADALEWINEMVLKGAEIVEDIFEKVGDWYEAHLQPIVENLAEFIKKYILPYLQSLWEFIENNFSGSLETLFEILGFILDVLNDLWEYLEDIGVIDAIGSAFETLAGWINTAREAFEKIYDWIKKVIDKLKEYKSLFHVDVSDMYKYAENSNGNIPRNAVKVASGGFSSGGVTLNASFNITNGNGIDRNTVLQWADVMTERINENLGAQI